MPHQLQQEKVKKKKKTKTIERCGLAIIVKENCTLL